MRTEFIEMMLAADEEERHDPQKWIEGFAQMRDKTALGPLGVEMTAIDDDGLELRMEMSDAARQPMGLLHGGVSMVLAESAASMHCCWKVDLSEKIPVGVEINGSHLGSITDGTVRVVAKLESRSRAFAVHQIDLYHEETGDHLCAARVRNYFRRWG
jgi:uncharacterized protein (TIGR00369 family)